MLTHGGPCVTERHLRENSANESAVNFSASPEGSVGLVLKATPRKTARCVSRKRVPVARHNRGPETVTVNCRRGGKKLRQMRSCNPPNTAGSQSECGKVRTASQSGNRVAERPLRLCGELNRSDSQKTEIHRHCCSVSWPRGDYRFVPRKQGKPSPPFALRQDNSQEITRTPEVTLQRKSQSTTT